MRICRSGTLAGVLRLPTSHRARVRLLRRSIIAVVLLGIAALIAFDRNSGHSTATPIDESKPAEVVRIPKTVRQTPQARAAAEATLGAFVRSAVIRRNLEQSWPLATPYMKVGTSHSDWLAGNLPVVPYPAGAFRTYGLTLNYSYKGTLGYDVLVLPNGTPAGTAAGQQIYLCELHDLRGSWLVQFCYPRKTL
jgi:hypothetical protein